MKNIDKVRKMTPEEVDSLFNPRNCPPSYQNGTDCRNIDCRDCWLEWMNQEEGE